MELEERVEQAVEGRGLEALGGGLEALDLFDRQVDEALDLAREPHEGGVAHQLEELGREAAHLVPVVVHGGDAIEAGRRVALDEGVDRVEEQAAVDQPQGVGHILGADLGPPEGEDLVEEGLGVAHRALARAGDQSEPGLVDCGALLGGDGLEALDHGARGDALEVEALHAGEDGVGDLARLGGGEEEHHVGWRLLERLQQRVEGRRRQHVDLVHQIDLVAALWRVLDRLAEAPDVVDRVVRGAVDLDEIGAVPARDLAAGAAGAAGGGGGPVHAVE